jgi:hypothetical protein
LTRHQAQAEPVRPVPLVVLLAHLRPAQRMYLLGPPRASLLQALPQGLLEWPL